MSELHKVFVVGTKWVKPSQLNQYGRALAVDREGRCCRSIKPICVGEISEEGRHVGITSTCFLSCSGLIQ